MLLLPGALGTGLSDFRPQLEGLNSTGNLSLVAWDPPGYGKSRPPERRWSDNFYESDARYAKEFMESLGHNQFSVVGWSDGGMCFISRKKKNEFDIIHMMQMILFPSSQGLLHLLWLDCIKETSRKWLP